MSGAAFLPQYVSNLLWWVEPWLLLSIQPSVHDLNQIFIAEQWKQTSKPALTRFLFPTEEMPLYSMMVPSPCFTNGDCVFIVMWTTSKFSPALFCFHSFQICGVHCNCFVVSFQLWISAAPLDVWMELNTPYSWTSLCFKLLHRFIPDLSSGCLVHLGFTRCLRFWLIKLCPPLRLETYTLKCSKGRSVQP